MIEAEADLKKSKLGDDSWRKEYRDDAARNIHQAYTSFKKRIKELKKMLATRGEWKKIESRY